MYEFLKLFNAPDIENTKKVGSQYFQVEDDLLDLSRKIQRNINRDPISVGLFLGEDKGNRFVPSVSLLDQIKTDQIVTVNDKAEWLFLCGRDLFPASIIEAKAKSGFVLVENLRNEVLGYGKIKGDLNKPKSIIENKLDRGDFLRREMNKKR